MKTQNKLLAAIMVSNLIWLSYVAVAGHNHPPVVLAGSAVMLMAFVVCLYGIFTHWDNHKPS